MKTIKWILDPAHSDVKFSVRHLVSKVSGYFKDFSASVETHGEDLTTAKVEFTARVNSISTNNEQRDQHLRSKDFFDAEKYPEITFRAEGMKKESNESYLLPGILTMHGVSKPVTLHVEFGGITTDPWGNKRAGFSVKGKINRKDFGIDFNMVVEAGGILIGDEVTVECNTEFIMQQAPEEALSQEDKKTEKIMA
jgi:polyisoprenoid-binding protein YceI